MQPPNRAGLHAALHAIRDAATQVKVYEAQPIDGLTAAIAAHLATVRGAEGLGGEALARRDRIVQQCTAVQEAVQRARQYPEHIMARAVVLDQAAALARQIREAAESFGMR
ncbi:MAG: hypothetical protein KIT25_06630 [Enhydrobacter sp.]|nr:MAG: hypothetical protein KIT25_06630 [Enhydrobacter sp.]